jgi:molybdate transport system permease protein
MTGAEAAGASAVPVRSPQRHGPRGASKHPAVIGVAAASVILLLFLALPVVVLVLRAVFGGTLLAAASDRAVLDALGLSLATTLVSIVTVVVLGTPLGFALARREFPGKWLAESIVDLPIVLPPSVAGLALLLAFGRRGALGPALDVAGLTISFTTLAVVLAQVFVAAPFFIRAARAGFRSVDSDLEDAARVDGAGGVATFRFVTLPLAAPAVSAGLVLAWARALGEFGATIMFAGNFAGRTQTLPLFVYSEFQSSLDASVAAASVLVVAAFGVLVAVRLTHWRSALDIRLTG